MTEKFISIEEFNELNVHQMRAVLGQHNVPTKGLRKAELIEAYAGIFPAENESKETNVGEDESLSKSDPSKPTDKTVELPKTDKKSVKSDSVNPTHPLIVRLKNAIGNTTSFESALPFCKSVVGNSGKVSHKDKKITIKIGKEKHVFECK